MADRRHVELQAFLEHPDRPEGTLRYHELQGFLFAVLSAPELVMPSEWIPVVFGDEEPVYADPAEAARMYSELLEVYNEVNATITEEGASLPVDCVFRDEILANLEQDAPVSRWARGFTAGYDWLQDLWTDYVSDEMDKAFGLGGQLLILSFFASRGLAESFCKELKKESLDEVATSMRTLFPGAMFEHASLGRAIYRAVLEVEETERQQPTTAHVKVGRNEPCPCGSGRKYKKCCGAGVR